VLFCLLDNIDLKNPFKMATLISKPTFAKFFLTIIEKFPILGKLKSRLPQFAAVPDAGPHEGPPQGIVYFLDDFWLWLTREFLPSARPNENLRLVFV
jgi:hypothetical protein